MTVVPAAEGMQFDQLKCVGESNYLLLNIYADVDFQ